MILRRPGRSFGITRRALWIWGLLFLAAGVVGQCVIQNGILKTSGLSNQQLVDMMADSNVLGYVTIALVLEAVQSCAIPVFALLTVEGFIHTSSLKNYVLRVAGLALLSEIPYNLAVGGSWLAASSRNPVFGVLLALVMLYLYRYYAGTTAKNIAIKALILVMGVLWTFMLGLADGAALVIMVSTFWFMRNKPQYRIFVGAVVMVLCCLISPYYIVAPIAMMAIHYYNGEPGEQSRWTRYLAYPAMLLVIWAAAFYFV